MAEKGDEKGERKRLTLLLPVEDIELIKSDAHALGWTPARYVSFLARTAGQSYEEVAKEIPDFTRAVIRSLKKSTVQELEK